MRLEPFNQTFGMPPRSYVSDTAIINSMPVMEIIPCRPQFQSGLTLFRVDPDWTTYRNLLKNLGYEISDNLLKFAFIADNFPTDTFTNDYGESFLQKFTDVASQGMSQITQMTGETEFTAAAAKMGSDVATLGEAMGGTLGGLVSGAGTMATNSAAALRTLKEKMKETGSTLGGAGDIIDKMMGGHRVDFPQLWRNSGYTPSYTATIRLYNPKPGSTTYTEQYIIGPLAVILALGIPRSKDGKTYSWPFFHKVKAKGIYNLDPAVISNITVIKGGDQQQISFNQHLAMVDVRIDFTSLYGSMLMEEGDFVSNNRPTIKSYLNSMKEQDSTLSYSRYQMQDAARISAGATNLDNVGNVRVTPSLSTSEQLLLAKNAAAAKRRAPRVQSTGEANRVPTDTALQQTDLANRSNPNFIL
jgi:hypothetical protein